MTISSTTTKVSYAGNGSTTVFAYTFKIFADADLEVIIRSSTGAETTKSLTTHYTVSGAGSDSGGNVTFGSAPASGETVVIRRNLGLTQGTDYVSNDPFPADSHEDALDRLTMITQGIQEELDRSIKASTTNTITSAEFTISASDRANKVFSFDSSGDLSITQELGTFKGNWAASTAYVQRDIVKDTSTNNIFIANADHTSSGSQPLTTNTDSAKWDLLVDAASATTSATNAASSATAAASSASAASTSATNAATSATNASTSATNAASSATAAAAAQAAAETAADNFDDTYLGAKSSDPTVDNDGDALTAGDLYFNTTSNELKVYNGSAWQVAAVSAAGLLAASNNLSDVASAATARTNLSAAASGANSDITSLTGLTTDLSVAQGGTGAGTFTTNGVLYGNGTSAIAATGTGTSGQVLTSNGSGSAPTFQAAAGGGKVIQVVTATTDTAVSSNSSTRADTGLSAAITPANTANKILVIISQHCSAGGGRAVGDIHLMRDSTDLINYSQQANADNAMGNFFFQYLDSPSATTSTTYKTQQARVDQSGVFVTSRDDSSGDGRSWITLIELDYS